MDPEDLTHINDLLDRDADLREDHVTDFDKKSRTMVGLLNKIHSTRSSDIPPLLDTVRPVLHSCRDTTVALANLVPADQFWRWKDMWSMSLRQTVFSALLIEYLTNGTLLSIIATSDQLGIQEEWKDRFVLSVEDYLHGVITMVNELSRFAVNAVTLGDFEAPIKISIFVKDLFAGFSMLNLKNDTLRRRYDTLKYDIKKIEEVVYDVSLRKLASPRAKDPTMDTKN